MKTLIVTVRFELNDTASVDFDTPIIPGLQSLIEGATRGETDDYEWTEGITKAEVSHSHSEEPMV